MRKPRSTLEQSRRQRFCGSIGGRLIRMAGAIAEGEDAESAD